VDSVQSLERNNAPIPRRNQRLMCLTQLLSREPPHISRFDPKKAFPPDRHS
jgi:hypothetical protein